MQRLSHRDLGIVLECLRGIYTTLDLQSFPQQVVAALRRVVHAPFGSYNEIDPRATRIRYVVEPTEALVSGLELISRQYMHEQPVVAHYLRTGDGSPRKLSDFLSQREFHRRGIYAENYRRTGVEYQMTFMVQSHWRQTPATIAIALDRGRGAADFSERDRLALTLLRPHLMTAHANAETFSVLRRRGPPGSESPEARRYETIVLGRGGRHTMSPRARRWLSDYFEDGPSRGGDLPPNLRQWVRQQVGCFDRVDTLPPPVAPLVVRREQRRLTVRLILNSPDDILVLDEEWATADHATLESFGLTPRQTQVLHWVAEGKSNSEIGIILGASHRTVAKHIERIHATLGVESRTAAARLALARTWALPTDNVS
jgi:DNA-binding CsgD family transcriptional regulator